MPSANPRAARVPIRRGASAVAVDGNSLLTAQLLRGVERDASAHQEVSGEPGGGDVHERMHLARPPEQELDRHVGDEPESDPV